MSAVLSPVQLSAALALRDLTDPQEGPHAVQQVVSLLEGCLQVAWGVPLVHSPGPRIVTVENNYDRLRYDPGDLTRAQRYTRYVGAGLMLRSHMSARIPTLLEEVTVPDVLLSAPGVCYRRDAIDRSHVGEPHQMDLWRIRAQGPPLQEKDLMSMIALVVESVLPGASWRAPRSVHPYTLLGREIYVSWEGVELEVGECGLAHPEVLARAGLPREASGLAMGVGLDRLVMLRKGIEDIRLLRSKDPRVVLQMLDLAPYRPVSMSPSSRRDLSVVVSEGLDEELLGGLVRDLLQDESEMLESVMVLSQTPWAALPESARERLGARAHQKNMLVRLILRPLVGTLTSTESNRIRDRVYQGIHQGAVGEWVSP